ncbi:hypothetical protein Geob_1453 [Geotalea daltonii FRC-32]|uniref:Uncharacterized protein n=1 Tax=Geotalea daltonii (strain DSM 22248 / JCM 15807 / FRC-32) TaxID=316067 RepID=B9M557_GEODF|nr:hypothetical protein [Geotalea daltonii]ACM19812.1 hypothetical protein Geob_1453 [Geotalea daltonii FRC-32]
MAINLIVQYYRCLDDVRQQEIDSCLQNNLLNEYLDAIHLLTEILYDFQNFKNSEKIVQSVVGKRLSYKKAFEYATSLGGDHIWILANADIYFDDNLKYLNGFPCNVVYSLTRHEVQPDGSVKFMDEQYAHASQDAWIFSSQLDFTGMYTEFNLGVPGCDNRIAYEFLRTGHTVVNPSRIVKCFHLDLTKEIDIEKRTAAYITLHTNENILDGKVAPPPYQFFIYPTDHLGVEQIDVYKDMQKKLIDLTHAYQDLDRYTAHNAELESRVVNLNRELEECREMILERNNQIAERDNQIARKDAQIAEILNSVTWKMMTPLRKCLDFIKRHH